MKSIVMLTTFGFFLVFSSVSFAGGGHDHEGSHHEGSHSDKGQNNKFKP